MAESKSVWCTADNLPTLKDRKTCGACGRPPHAAFPGQHGCSVADHRTGLPAPQANRVHPVFGIVCALMVAAHARQHHSRTAFPGRHGWTGLAVPDHHTGLPAPQANRMHPVFGVVCALMVAAHARQRHSPCPGYTLRPCPDACPYSARVWLVHCCDTATRQSPRHGRLHSHFRQPTRQFQPGIKLFRPELLLTLPLETSGAPTAGLTSPGGILFCQQLSQLGSTGHSGHSLCKSGFSRYRPEVFCRRCRACVDGSWPAPLSLPLLMLPESVKRRTDWTTKQGARTCFLFTALLPEAVQVAGLALYLDGAPSALSGKRAAPLLGFFPGFLPGFPGASRSCYSKSARPVRQVHPREGPAQLVCADENCIRPPCLKQRSASHEKKPTETTKQPLPDQAAVLYCGADMHHFSPRITARSYGPGIMAWDWRCSRSVTMITLPPPGL